MRVGISGALGPRSKVGLSPDETTIAEICKSRGYATACVGKWHLGQEQKFLPLQQGFDQYYGLPYSNDMWPQHPSLAKLPPGAAERKAGYPNLPLIEGNEIVDPDVTAVDQTRLTTDYTKCAVRFIREHRDQPFFLYLAHSMVHVPLFVSEAGAGKSGEGLFGDVMQEVDWSVGQVLDALIESGIDDNTLVIFSSDNGPWLCYGSHAGSAGPLREGKGTSFEGGVRVPTIMRWPGRIPPGSRCNEFAATIDVLPTVAKLIDADLPALPIDGHDISSLMFVDPPPESPHESYFIYYGSGQLQAVRDRRWKLVLPHRYTSLAGMVEVPAGSPMPYVKRDIELSMFDLKADPGESRDVISDHPEIAAQLQARADEARALFGDEITKAKGDAIRGPGRTE
jgi:arylsulfatase A-like enzyme